ncbi:MAG: ABC transporter substrate-binding protein [Ktedonobacteraceae bacterium]
MHRKWSLTAYVIAMVTMLFLTACGGSSTGNGSNTSSSTPGMLDSSKKYTVNFWEAFASGANKTSLEALTKQYMQKHSNVTVNLQAYDSYATLKTKITAAIAAGKPPAISQVYEEWATQYQQSNQIVSLQPFISGKNGFSQSELLDFYPSMLKDGQLNGKQYMLPFNKSVIVLYYNADALKAAGINPPTTIDEMMTDLTKVTKPDGSQWGLSYTPDVDLWSILYKSFGGTDFVSADGKTVAFANGNNVTAAKQALNELTPLVQSKALHVTTGYNWQNDFASQKSVFAISTVASYSFIKKAIGGAFQFSEAPIPAGPKGQFTTLFGTNLAMYAGVDADTQSAAWDYMKFLTNPDSIATFVQQTGYMPVRQSAFNSSALQDYFTKNPTRKAGPQSLQYGFVASTVPAWDQCRNIISNAFTSVLKGQLSADDAFSKMVSSSNAALSQG